MLSKITQSKFTYFFRVPKQFIIDMVTLFQVPLYLKLGDKEELSNQVDHLLNIPLGILIHKKITLELQFY